MTPEELGAAMVTMSRQEGESDEQIYGSLTEYRRYYIRHPGELEGDAPFPERLKAFCRGYDGELGVVRPELVMAEHTTIADASDPCDHCHENVGTEHFDRTPQTLAVTLCRTCAAGFIRIRDGGIYMPA